MRQLTRDIYCSLPNADGQIDVEALLAVPSPSLDAHGDDTPPQLLHSGDMVLNWSSPVAQPYLPRERTGYVHPSASSLSSLHIELAGVFARLHRAEILNDKKGRRHDSGHASLWVHSKRRCNHGADLRRDTELPQLPDVSQAYCSASARGKVLTQAAVMSVPTSIFHYAFGAGTVEVRQYRAPSSQYFKTGARTFRDDTHGVPLLWMPVAECSKCHKAKKGQVHVCKCHAAKKRASTQTEAASASDDIRQQRNEDHEDTQAALTKSDSGTPEAQGDDVDVGAADADASDGDVSSNADADD